MEEDTAYTDLLKRVLAIPATSRNEKERADFLEGYLKRMGLSVTRYGQNLLVGQTGTAGSAPVVLLASHMDTVAPSEGWKTDPFKPVDGGDRITGLGSNDAGGAVVTMIHAYLAVRGKLDGKVNLLLLICAEEEVSGSGGITSVLDKLGKLDGVVVGEPTGMQPAVAERGLMVVDGEARGKAGHAGRKEGVNAIYSAMEDIQAITGLNWPESSSWLPDPGAQVTMIEAGTNHNVVPDVCRFVVDVRSNDRYSNERILEMLRGVCSSQLTPRSTRLRSSVLEDDHFLMQTVRTCAMKPFGSSTLSDMALIPFPSVKLGPGRSERSHTAGEYILKQELKEGVQAYTGFLEAMGKVLAGEGSQVKNDGEGGMR